MADKQTSHSPTACLHCNAPIEQPLHGGRPRQYCQKAACRKAQSRARQKAEAERHEQDQIAELTLRWHSLQFHEATRAQLKTILFMDGVDAAVRATEALEKESRVQPGQFVVDTQVIKSEQQELTGQWMLLAVLAQDRLEALLSPLGITYLVHLLQALLRHDQQQLAEQWTMAAEESIDILFTPRMVDYLEQVFLGQEVQGEVRTLKPIIAEISRIFFDDIFQRFIQDVVSELKPRLQEIEAKAREVAEQIPAQSMYSASLHDIGQLVEILTQLLKSYWFLKRADRDRLIDIYGQELLALSHALDPLLQPPPQREKVLKALKKARL